VRRFCHIVPGSASFEYRPCHGHLPATKCASYRRSAQPRARHGSHAPGPPIPTRRHGKGTMRDDKPASKAKGERAVRLAEQLRANLQKRKAQARARRAGEGDSQPDGIRAADKPER